MILRNSGGILLVLLSSAGFTAPSETASESPDRQAYLNEFLARQPVRTQPDPTTGQRTIVSASPTASSSARQASKQKLSGSSFVPPGFEDLLEPQTTVVDVYYGSTYLTSSTATYTPSTISFLTPQDIVDRIPDLLEPELIAATLAGEMPSNAELICYGQRSTGCGTIETETVDVIFDEGHFRADLFIAPALLSVRSAINSRYLPPSSAGWSILNSTSATVNGSEGSDPVYNVGNSTTLAFRENRLVAISNVTQDDDLTVDTLALQREFNGRQFQAGIFRSSPGNLIFLGQADYQGISVASSLNTRQDLDQSAGNDIQVFLDSRSRVDIIKDGRLVSTAVYDTGNQILDTSQLPGGAYEVTLRVRDNFGNSREETRFYVKTSRLPPKDQPLFFVEAGETVSLQSGDTLPTGTGEDFFRAGYAKRISDNFGGELGIFSSNGANIFEAGLFRLGQSYEIRINAATTNQQSYGVNVNARTRVGIASLHTSLRRTWSSADETTALGNEAIQGSLNLTVPLGRSALNLTARYNDRDESTDRNIGIRYDFPTYSFGNTILDTSLNITENNDSLLVLFGGRLSLRSDRWGTQVSSRFYREDTDTESIDQGTINSLSTTWQDRDRFASDVSVNLRANDGRDDRTIETELDITSSLGRTNLEAIYSEDAGELSYGGSFYTSFIANSQTLALGARQQGQSAVVLDIDGDAIEGWFDVRVNGMNRGTARVGDRTIVGLAPYETYNVTLRPNGESIVDFDQRARTATLYPGNVVTMNWSATRVVIAFGQILTPAGNPVSNAVIEGVIGLATTDEFGLFQAEFSSDVEQLVVRTRRSRCSVALPDYDATALIATLGELTCMPVDHGQG